MKKTLASIAAILCMSAGALAQNQTGAEASASQKQAVQALQKQRDALAASTDSASKALQALDTAFNRLIPVQATLLGSRTVQDAQGMVELGMPADAFLRTLDEVRKLPAETLRSAGLQDGMLQACQEAVRQLMATKGLDASAIDARIAAKHGDQFKKVQEAQDPEFLAMFRAMLVAGWLEEETDRVLKSIAVLQKQLSGIVGSSIQQLRQLDEQQFQQSLKAVDITRPSAQQ